MLIVPNHLKKKPLMAGTKTMQMSLKESSRWRRLSSSRYLLSLWAAPHRTISPRLYLYTVGCFTWPNPQKRTQLIFLKKPGFDGLKLWNLRYFLKKLFPAFWRTSFLGIMEIPTHLESPKEAGKTICVVGITIYKHCLGFPSLMARHSRNIALKSLSLSKHIQWLFCVHWKNNTFSDLSNGSIWRTMPPCIVSHHCILILDSRCSRRMLTTYD